MESVWRSDAHVLAASERDVIRSRSKALIQIRFGGRRPLRRSSDILLLPSANRQLIR